MLSSDTLICSDASHSEGAWSGLAGGVPAGGRVQVPPDGVVVHGRRQRHEDVPDGVGERDHAVTLEEEHAGAVDEAAARQLLQPLRVALGGEPELKHPDRPLGGSRAQMKEKDQHWYHGRDHGGGEEAHGQVEGQLHHLVPARRDKHSETEGGPSGQNRIQIGLAQTHFS